MKWGVFFVSVILLMGCNANEDQEDSKLALIKTTDPTPIQLEKKGPEVEKIKKEVERIDEIYDVAVIKDDHHILIAYKVKHLQRFRMKKIEKELNKRLEKEYKDEEFIVSSDYKIFLEVVRLREKIDEGTINKKEAQKRFNEILELKKEMT